MRLTRFTRSQISAGAHGGSQLGHISGMNPRKFKLTASIPGSNPKRQGIGSGRTHMGMSQHTAPYKHQSHLFGSNIGIEGPEEGLPP